MRTALAFVCVVASAFATAPTRLVVVGAALSGISGQKECTVELATPDPLPDGRVGQAYFVQMFPPAVVGGEDRPAPSEEASA